VKPLEAGVPDRRNLWAYVALWLVVTSWVLLGLRMMAGEIGAVDDAIDWLYVGVVGAGFLVAAVGVTAVRKRGEPLLAVAVPAFSLRASDSVRLVLPALGAALPRRGSRLASSLDLPRRPRGTRL
jgi:hypothetical protein